MEILKRFQMENLKTKAISIDAGTKLTKATKDSKLFTQEIYQSAIGNLMYLSTKTQVVNAVVDVARFCFQPAMQHWDIHMKIGLMIEMTAH